MTSEQKGVDVLAVIGTAASLFRVEEGAGSQMAAELEKARFIVAELIEAAKRANGDHSAPHDCYATGPLTGDPIRDLVECPGCVLAATLTAMRGQP